MHFAAVDTGGRTWHTRCHLWLCSKVFHLRLLSSTARSMGRASVSTAHQLLNRGIATTSKKPTWGHKLDNQGLWGVWCPQDGWEHQSMGRWGRARKVGSSRGWQVRCLVSIYGLTCHQNRYSVGSPGVLFPFHIIFQQRCNISSKLLTW